MKRGSHHTEEVKKKIRDSISGENSPWFGKHLSEEHKRKLSKSNFGI